MARKLQIKRGLQANLPSLAEGELGLTTDQKKVYIGHTDGNIELTTINNTLTLGETSTSAYRGDRGKTAYDHTLASHAPSNAQKNSDITKAEIEAKLTGTITTHNHTPQTSVTGNAGTATKLQTARKINGVAFDGTQNITIADGTKAPINHTSSDAINGRGTQTLYGHCQIINGLSQSAYADGQALSAYQGKVLNGAINTKAPAHQVGTTVPSAYVGAGVLYGVY